jgi:hypothetical protein
VTPEELRTKCHHRRLVAWSLETGEPVDMWSCGDCDLRFFPATPGQDVRVAELEAEVARLKAERDTPSPDAQESWEWVVIEVDGDLLGAAGDAPTREVAEREGQHYMLDYIADKTPAHLRLYRVVRTEVPLEQSPGAEWAGGEE